MKLRNIFACLVWSTLGLLGCATGTSDTEIVAPEPNADVCVVGDTAHIKLGSAVLLSVRIDDEPAELVDDDNGVIRSCPSRSTCRPRPRSTR